MESGESSGQVSTKGEITRLISEYLEGDVQAGDRLFSAIYGELRALAVQQLRNEKPDHSLCPTDLVNEAYLRIAGQRTVEWADRAHFFRVAAKIIRRVLVDHARSRNARKRGGNARREALSTIVDARAIHSRLQHLDVLALEEALEQLSEKSPPRAEVVELRFYAGLNVEETARVMGVAGITVKRHWKFARAWLFSRMKEATEAP
jgi:RNA polymerase sigma factor (TIGR02999 family)